MGITKDSSEHVCRTSEQLLPSLRPEDFWQADGLDAWAKIQKFGRRRPWIEDGGVTAKFPVLYYWIKKSEA